MVRSRIPILTAADDIQDPSKGWQSTISFRRFRRKQSELSKLYWTSEMGSYYIAKHNSIINDSDKLSFVGQPFPFGGSVLPLTKTEMAEWLPSYSNGIRNAILTLCSGNLELYLKKNILIHLLYSGYSAAESRFKLNPVGLAIGHPVIKKSTIPNQIKYIENLLGIEFKRHVDVWEKAYKERCTLAHQAGIISNIANDEPLNYNEDIQTEWPSLLQVLDSTNQIVGLIDQKIATPSLRLLELEFELAVLKKARKLPRREILWSYVHSNLGCNLPGKAEKLRIESELF